MYRAFIVAFSDEVFCRILQNGFNIDFKAVCPIPLYNYPNHVVSSIWGRTKMTKFVGNRLIKIESLD